MNQTKNEFIKGVLCGTLIMLIIVLAIVGTISVLNMSKYDGIVSDEVEEKIGVIQSIIDAEFLYDVDEKSLEDGIYLGIMYGLDDPYSTYYNEEETAALLETTSGKYHGIGASLLQDMETGVISIVDAFQDAPAANAGLESGDIIEMVDGEAVTGVDLNSVVADIKGEAGTEVVLGIIKNKTGDRVDVAVERALVEEQTVSYEMKEDGVGYLEVTQFSEITLEQYTAALDDLIAQGMESLVIDLRNNPGGNLDTVCNMLDVLLPEGVLVYTEDKQGNRTDYTSTGDDTFDKPLVVLVNNYSASASEIFASAVQDYEIGTIVGETTYGKGVVQQIYNLNDGTMMKLTESEYFTPNGNKIHEVGVTPDYEVEQEYPEGDEEDTVDEQLEKAIEVLE